jgi:hypothetical protein
MILPKMHQYERKRTSALIQQMERLVLFCTGDAGYTDHPVLLAH